MNTMLKSIARHLLFSFVTVIFMFTSQSKAGRGPVLYQIDGERFEGYYLSPREQAPLVILVHDWDGITAYEQQRAQMLVISLGRASDRQPRRKRKG